MLTSGVAKELVKRVSGITKNPIAVLDLGGNILSQSEDFKYGESHIEVKQSKKSILITVEGEKEGYIYLDATPSVVSEESEVLRSMVELILHQKLILESVTTEDRKINKFIYDLLHQVDYDTDEAIAEANVYGYDLTIPRAAIIIDMGGEIQKKLYSENLSCDDKDSFWAKVRRTISSASTSFYTRNHDNIIAYVGSSRFVFLKDLGNGDAVNSNFKHILKTLNSFHYILKNELRSPITIGVGRYYPGVGGLKESFEEALLAMSFGEQVWGKDKIYNFDSFGVVAPLINGDTDSIDFPKNIFESFSNEEFKKTLDVFFDNDMSLTATAKKLNIHRNTLVYRLDRIAEKLGLDPRTFDDAVQIKLSMLFGEILH